MRTHVQEEIIIDILSRLPVKSLLRFNCVSEFWKTLISEPCFKEKHLNHAKNQPDSQKMLFFERSPEDNNAYFYCSPLSVDQLVADFRRFDWPSNSTPSNCIYIYPCCCDGLFLIGIWGIPNQEEPSILLIWNPSTGESIVLPNSESSPEESTYGLEYDSSSDEEEYKRASLYGLGYDSTSDDYKVLRIDMSEYDQKDEIFALKSGLWRKISGTSGRTDNTLLFDRQSLAFVHGAFHWLGLLSRFAVITFSISDEMYGEIPLPEIICLILSSKTKVDKGVSVLGGMFCVYYNEENFFNLWIMKDYGVIESWTKLFTISNNGIPYIEPTYRFSDDEVLLSYEEQRTTAIVYRIIHGGLFGTSNRIWPLDCDDMDAVTIVHRGIVYTESLISPKLDH